MKENKRNLSCIRFLLKKAYIKPSIVVIMCCFAESFLLASKPKVDIPIKIEDPIKDKTDDEIEV